MESENNYTLDKKLENERIAINARKSFNPINPAMPVRVNIATTDGCNLRCPMCISPFHDECNELPFETFEELGSELFPRAKEYHTTLAGEPLVTSYFRKIPEILQQYNTKMSFVTNGILLTQDISELIMPVLRDIKVSFDGATKETFQKVRPNADFEGILSNIEKFVELRNNSPYNPTITLLPTVMYDNVRELPDIVELAHDLGVDRVKVCFMVLRNPDLMDQSLWFHKELANEYLDKSIELAESYGIKTKFYKKFNLDESYLHRKRDTWKIDCRFLWEEGWVKVDGNVIPCCNIDTPVVGNIYEESFTDIWNNNMYQDMRQRLNSDDPYECCKHCILPNEDVNSETYNYEYGSLILI